MNKDRRARLTKAKGLLEEAVSMIEAIKDEEEEYKDNMPENLQGSEKYANAENAVEILDATLEQINVAVENIEEVIAE